MCEIAKTFCKCALSLLISPSVGSPFRHARSEWEQPVSDAAEDATARTDVDSSGSNAAGKGCREKAPFLLPFLPQFQTLPSQYPNDLGFFNRCCECMSIPCFATCDFNRKVKHLRKHYSLLTIMEDSTVWTYSVGLLYTSTKTFSLSGCSLSGCS